jgi:ABC-2 type transport system permease protein
MKLAALLAFMRKEVRHILRDRQTLTILLLMPLVQVILFGYALRSDVREVRLAVVDPSPDFATLSIRSRFAGSGRFRIVAVERETRSLDRMLRAGDVDLVLAFEPDFAGHLQHGDEPAGILLAVDAADPNTGTTILAYARAVVAGWQESFPRNAGQVSIGIQTRMRFNPTLESVNLFVPGLIALVLTLVSALMTAISLSREKERGTMEVLLVSPLHPWQIITGKVLPYLGLALANVVTALLAARLVFNVPMKGSLILLIAECLMYSIVSLALGIFIAARTNSQRAALFAALMGTLLPNTLLSGMIFPIASLPKWLAVISSIVPARWFLVIARGIMLKGTGITYLWHETAVLFFMMVVILTAAMASVKPRLS